MSRFIVYLFQVLPSPLLRPCPAVTIIRFASIVTLGTGGCQWIAGILRNALHVSESRRTGDLHPTLS